MSTPKWVHLRFEPVGVLGGFSCCTITVASVEKHNAGKESHLATDYARLTENLYRFYDFTVKIVIPRSCELNLL